MKKIRLTVFFALSCFVGFTQNKQEIEKLKQKLQSAKDDAGKVELLHKLASSYNFTYPDTSIIYYEQELELSRKLELKNGEIRGLRMLSMSLSILGNFKAALSYGLENLAEAEKLKDSSLISQAYQTLLVCYREQEDYKEALKYGLKSLNFSSSPTGELNLKVFNLTGISVLPPKGVTI